MRDCQLLIPEIAISGNRQQIRIIANCRLLAFESKQGCCLVYIHKKNILLLLHCALVSTYYICELIIDNMFQRTSGTSVLSQ